MEKYEENLETDIVVNYLYIFQYYNATVTAVTERTYVVKFKGYDNIEEVLKKDCQPLGTKNNRKYDNNRSYSGGNSFIVN